MLNSGERQVAPTVDGIRRDHVARYDFAAGMVSGRVLDLACGVGYGASILADAGCEVLAIDRSYEAIEYGRENYGRDGIEFRWADAAQFGAQDGQFDAAVCFETIEHIERPEGLLRAMHDAAPMLVASVPNQDVFPHRNNRFHFRHYTRAQFQDLLERVGWSVVGWYGQDGPQSEVEPDCMGRTIIAVCERGKERSARMDGKIIYEPHPVSPERKAELRAAGYTIIDAIYEPKGEAKAADEITRDDIDKMPRAEVVEMLAAHGVEGATGKVADLREWLKRVMFVDL